MPQAFIPLEIHIHLEDRRITKYVQSDPESARNILDHIQPGKFFAQRQLIIQGIQSMTALQCSRIVRVDLITSDPPHWPFHNQTESITEISEQEFAERYRPGGPIALPSGQVGTLYAEMEMTSSERIFFELRVHGQSEEILPLDQGVFIQQMFAGTGMHAHRRGGGWILVNPANILRFTTYPGPQSAPPGSWRASRI